MRRNEDNRPGGGGTSTPALTGTPTASKRTYEVPANASELFDSIT